MAIRNSDKNISFTIAPTMDCCFTCFYCFEKGNHRKTYMSEKVMNSIIKNIENRKNLQSINITWFGGEPLMAIDKMREFYKKLRKVWKGDFTSRIITTAHNITPEVIDILKEIEVTNMQITLDGVEKTHNAIKFTKGCDNAFQKVVAHIDLLTEKYPELQIDIRVNITKKNAAEYIDLHNFIRNRYAVKPIGTYPGIVANRSKDKKIDKDSSFFNNNDCALFSIDLWNNYKITTNWLSYGNSMTYECAMRNKNFFSVDPEGYIYQCWEVIGNKKHSIGKLDKDGNITDINHTELNRNLYGADPLENQDCIKCSYLPMCAGGCPIQRVENEFEGGCNELCTKHSTSYFYLYNNLQNSIFKEQINANLGEYIGLNLSIPIFNRFSVINQAKQAKFNIENQKLVLENTKKQLYKEIQTAYLNVVSANEKQNAATQAVTATQEAFRYAKERYENGKSSVFELAQSQNRLALIFINHFCINLSCMYIRMSQKFAHRFYRNAQTQ